MSVNVKNENGTCRIDITGDMTIYAALQLKDELCTALSDGNDRKKVAINLAVVSEIDASGLQLMALARNEAIARGITLNFVEHSNAVKDVLDLCNLASEFDCHEDHSPATTERESS